MPTYDYTCESCQSTHEIFQKITDDHLTACPSCNKHSLKRGPGGGIGLSFQGSGFYITDYTKNNTNSNSCACSKNVCTDKSI